MSIATMLARSVYPRLHACDIFRVCRCEQVLSVGGNDARIRFLQSRNPDVITQLMVTDGLVANLRRVIEIIHSEVTPNIILVYV